MATRIPLQLKVIVAIVVIVMAPLAIAVYLISDLGHVAANFASNEADARIGVMEKTLRSYRSLVDTTKRLHSEIATHLAEHPELIDNSATRAQLAKILVEEPDLRAIALVDAKGTEVARSDRTAPGAAWRDTQVDQPLPHGTLHLTFSVSSTLQDELGELSEALKTARKVAEIRTALPDSYRNAFLAVVGIAGVLAVILGWAASRSVTRKIGTLVETARKVSTGHVEARATIKGKDEMAELGDAFNTMLDDLDETRKHVEYLQRMGVWQDVARRLAHEIKNPLTPIQLAVQQCVSSYKGDDARFKKLLTDTGEIVEEEIEGLRRLVDTFRTLGALPKVEKAPIALAELIEELQLDPQMAARLTLKPPLVPVTVRADKLLLKRVLANLVENGIHAGIEAGTAGDVQIAWTADERGDAVVITVDDHGKGVAAESREKIFEPYVTTKATGTGLGLAISRKIAIEHGGELAVAPDRAPTGGARFVVSLPLRGPDASLS